MTLVTESWLADSLLLLVVLLWLFNTYLTSTGAYFRAHGIPYLKRNPFMSFLEAVSKSQMEQSLSYYKRFQGEKYYGYVQARVPTLLVRDPDLIHCILVKDFMHFQDRNFGVTEGDELVTKNLFHMRGESWKELRNKLIPTFTSGKLKLMFTQFMKCGEHMLEDIETGVPVEAKNLSTSFSIEVIGSTAFGLSFTKDNPQYAEFISRLSTLFVSGGFRGMLLGILVHFAPKLLKLFKLSFVTPGAEEYFVNIIRATKEHRKSTNIKRNDYFQLLMSLQEAEQTGKSSETAAVTDSSEDDFLINQMKYASQSSSTSRSDLRFFTDKGFAAQAVVFLIGGSESVSGTISFALYHIARDPDIQREVISEVDTVLAKYHGIWSYEALKELVYLDQVIQETMRLYPIIPLNNRECTIPYHIPDSDIVLEKGMKVAIPVAGIHMDPEYYPDPEVFNPERFAGNNHKPSSKYMPFGDGPRICIAMRFALLEMKVCLAMVACRYWMDVDQKTRQPLRFEHKAFSPKAEGGLWLRFKERQSKMIKTVVE